MAGKTAPASPSDDTDGLVGGHCKDGNQANNHRQQNKHMEIVHHLVCWESKRSTLVVILDDCSSFVCKVSVRRIDKTNVAAQFKTIGTL